MVKSKYKNEYSGMLHRHPKMEGQKNVPLDHVIVDRSEWEKTRQFLIERKAFMKMLEPVYTTFKDFWKDVPKPGVAVLMSFNDLRQWSENVFRQSRIKKLN